MSSIRYSTFKPAVPWVLLVSLMFFINYTNRSIFGPLLVDFEREFGIDHAQATRLLFYLYCGFSFSMAMSGFAAAKIKPKLAVGLSTIFCGIVIFLISRLHSIDVAWIFFIALGLSGGFYFTSAMATLGELVTPRDWGKAVTLHELAPPLSFILAPQLAHLIIFFDGATWRSVLAGLGGFSCLAGMFFIIFARGGEKKASPPSLGHFRLYLKSPVLWLFAWIFALGIGGEFAPYSVLPLHLTTERGLSEEAVGRLLSLTRLAAPLAVLAGGALISRFRAKTIVTWFLFTHALSLLCMALPQPGLARAGMFVQPLVTACVFPAIFTLFAENFPLEHQPMLLGLAVPVSSYIGSGIFPALLGLWGNYLGFQYGFAMMAVFCLISLPFLRVVK